MRTFWCNQHTQSTQKITQDSADRSHPTIPGSYSRAPRPHSRPPVLNQQRYLSTKGKSMKLSQVQACSGAAALATLSSAAQAFVASTTPFLRTGMSSNARVEAASTPVSMMTSTNGAEFTANLPGAPFGMAADGKYFDPAGLAKTQDPQVVKKWREAELKHRRVAMLAAMGILVAEVFHPLFMGSEYIGPAISHFQEITSTYPWFWVASLTGVAFVEGKTIQKGWGTVSGMTGVGDLKESYYPGDLGFDPLGIAPKNTNEFTIIQTQELDLGRIAMIGVTGMLAQEVVDGRGILEHILNAV